MRALIWKEFRERRVWILFLLASSVFAMLGGSDYTFVSVQGVGLFGISNEKTLVTIFITFCFGTGAFSSEISGAAGFLLAQPVSWKRLFLAKLIVGSCVIIASALLSAGVYRLICPQQYLPFIDFSGLAAGVERAILLTGAAFLLGMVCSTVYPSAGGGVFVGMVLFFLFLLNCLLYVRFAPWGAMVPLSPFAWELAMVAAMLITARFGLTLTTRDRLVRYARAFFPVVVVCSVLSLSGLTPDRSQMNYLMHRNDEFYASVNPEAKSAVVPPKWGDYRFTGSVGKNRSLPIPFMVKPPAFFWPDSSTVVTSLLPVQSPGRQRGGNPEIRAEKPVPIGVYRINSSGYLDSQEIDPNLGRPNTSVLVPSPDGRRFLVAPAELRNKLFDSYDAIVSARAMPGSTLYTAKVIPASSRIGVLDCTGKCRYKTYTVKPAAIWWQSDDEIGYISAGKRHTLPVP